MLSSLLSLYIASIIQNTSTSTFINRHQSPSFVTTTSANLSNIENNKFIPLKNPKFLSPIIKARASLSMDLKTGVILYEKNSHDRLAIGSLTKLITATIIIEENNLDEIATVSKKAAQTNGSIMFLVPGETISVQNLLYGLIINSGNDAAVALAEHNAGNVDKFVKKMNKKALALGLLNTHFSNPVGLDNSQNYSSAYDLAKLSQYVYQKKLIKKIAATKTIKVYSSDGKYTHKLKSTNDLLGLDFIKFKGLKTGTTDQAGLCIISIAENKDGNEILDILLHSPARFRESKILADWIFRAYNWQNK